MKFFQPAIFIFSSLFSNLGLVWSQILSYILTIIFSLLSSINKIKKSLIFNKSSKSYKEIFLKYKKFPMLDFPASLIDTLGANINIWLIAYQYGTSTLGQFSLIEKIIGAPILLLSLGIGSVFYRESIELKNEPIKLIIFTTKILKQLIFLGLVLIIFTLLFGNIYVKFLLKENWLLNFESIFLITIGVIVKSIVSPLTNVITTINKMEYGFIWQVTRLITGLIILGLSSSYLDFQNYLLIMAFYQLTIYYFYSFFIFRALNEYKLQYKSKITN